MSHRRLLFYTAAGALASACASAPPATPEAQTSATTRETQTTSVGGWSGTFQATQERTGAVAPTRQQKTTGTVRLRPSARDPQRTNVALVISMNVQEPTALRWAVLPGRCGAGSLPLLGFDQFAPLEVGTSGRGQLDVDIPLPLPQTGQYHVNVYLNGTQLDDVVTCATLRRD